MPEVERGVGDMSDQGMARLVSLAGINGERAEVIRWCLENEGSAAGQSAHEIADFMFKVHRGLLGLHAGSVEKVQAVLRTMEANGEVVRTRRGNGLLYDHWRLASRADRGTPPRFTG